MGDNQKMMEGSGEGKALYSEREEQVQNLEESVPGICGTARPGRARA